MPGALQKDLYIFTERAHFHNPSIHVIAKVTVLSPFEENRLKSALRAVRRAHPLVGATIAVDKGGKAYYQTGKAPVAKPAIKPRADGDAWLLEVQAQFAKAFDFAHGPLVRCTILKDENTFDIVLAVHHLVCDGLAIVNLMRDLLASYAGGKLRHRPQKLIGPADVSAKPTLPVRIFAYNMNRNWEKQPKRFTQAEYQEMFRQQHGAHPVQAGAVFLEEGRLRELRAKCSRNNVTVNSALATAFLRALQHGPRPGGKPPVLGVPVSVRGQLPFLANDCLGNFASGVSLRQTYDPNLGFWENAKAIHSQLARRIADSKAVWVLLNLYASMRGDLIDAAYYSAAGHYHGKAAKIAAKMLGLSGSFPNVGLSNLGRIELPAEIGGLPVRDFVFFSPKTPSAYLTLGAATHNGTLGLGFLYDASCCNQDAVGKLRQSILEPL